MAECRCPEGCNGCEILSVEEIAQFLQHQADLRSLENDERGLLLCLRDKWITDLCGLDMTTYGNLNYD